MKIASTRFGDVEVGEDRLLTFPEGLPGFEGKRYALVEREETPAVEWLLSLTEPDVALMLIDPEAYDLDYVPKPKDAELSPLRPGGAADPIAFRVVIRNGEEPGETFLNLFAPILINFSKKLAMQVPLVGSGYAVREPLG